MVLFSPAPIPLQTVQVDRLLVFEGQFDPGQIRAFAGQIRSAATGQVEIENMRWTGHSGGLLRPKNMERTIRWLGGEPKTTEARLRFVLLAVSAIGGLGAALAGVSALPMQTIKSAVTPTGAVAIAYYVVAAIAATATVSFLNLFSWLQLYATHYLIGILFITGLLLLVRARGTLTTSLYAVLISFGVTAYVVVLLNMAGSELGSMTIHGSRWWRFPAITLLSLTLFVADEAFLRGLRPKWKAHAVAIITRLALTAIIVSGALILYRGAAFLLLMMPAVAVFWILLWFAGQKVRERTDAFSTALFAALLQAWVFSALFVIT
jgi:hypothetical protein